MRYIFLLLIFCCCIPVCFAAADLLPEKIAPGSAVATEAVAISDTEPSWGIIVILLMLGGFFFMFMEIAIIPGFGMTGIIGIVLLLGGIIAAYMKLSTFMAVLATLGGIFGVVLLMLWFFFVFPKTRLGKQFVLEADSSVENGYIAVDDNERYIGKTGVTTTVLRPSGIARIEGERVDVITDGEFVEKGVEIRVPRSKTGNGKAVFYLTLLHGLNHI
jgi:membrane-bound ClpP family serine protease